MSDILLNRLSLTKTMRARKDEEESKDQLENDVEYNAKQRVGLDYSKWDKLEDSDDEQTMYSAASS